MAFVPAADDAAGRRYKYYESPRWHAEMKLTLSSSNPSRFSYQTKALHKPFFEAPRGEALFHQEGEFHYFR